MTTITATAPAAFVPPAQPAERATTRPVARTGANPQFLARLTGVLFLITYATSIPPAASLYIPALSDPAFILGGGLDVGVTWGAFLEVLLIIANIGTAVALYPVLRRRHEVLSVSYITARLVECGFIAVGILSLLTLQTLRIDAAGSDAATMVVLGKSLVAMHDWTFLLGPGTVVGVGNGLILGYMMWKTRLVPRALSVLGLIGGPALLVAATGVILGVVEQGSSVQVFASMPEFFWELFLGLWLTIKGFNPKALESLSAAR